MFMIIHFALQKKLFLLRLAAWLCFTFAVVKQDSPPSVRRSLSTLASPFLVRASKEEEEEAVSHFFHPAPKRQANAATKEKKGVVGLGIGASAAQGKRGSSFLQKGGDPSARLFHGKKAAVVGSGALSPPL